MATRTKSGTVTFARPFFLHKINRELPAGSYAVETEEEALEGVSTLTYRRVEFRVFVPAMAGRSEAEMWVVSPGDFDAALALDREPSSPSEPDLRRTGPHPAAARLIEELALRNRHKGGNGPLYGTCLGILALLLATAVVGQQKRSENPPPAQAAQARAAGEN